MDVNIKKVDPEVLRRLAEQASAEGVSQQEWLRQVLGRTAARLSPAELVAQRSQLSPMTEEEFATLHKRVAERRRRTAKNLGGTGRRS